METRKQPSINFNSNSTPLSTPKLSSSSSTASPSPSPSPSSSSSSSSSTHHHHHHHHHHAQSDGMTMLLTSSSSSMGYASGTDSDSAGDSGSESGGGSIDSDNFGGDGCTCMPQEQDDVCVSSTSLVGMATNGNNAVPTTMPDPAVAVISTLLSSSSDTMMLSSSYFSICSPEAAIFISSNNNNNNNNNHEIVMEVHVPEDNVSAINDDIAANVVSTFIPPQVTISEVLALTTSQASDSVRSLDVMSDCGSTYSDDSTFSASSSLSSNALMLTDLPAIQEPVLVPAEVCVVCLDAQVAVVLPCGHAVLCVACSTQLLSGVSLCPLCRGAFVSYQLTDSNNPFSQDTEKLFEKGCEHIRGDATTASTQTGFQFFLAAAKLGHAPSQNHLAALLETGSGCDRNENQAEQWYLRAAASGNAEAECSYGRFIFHGKNGWNNKSSAVRWFKRAVRHGCVVAMVDLAICNDQGSGVPQNHRKAAHLFHRAAMAGSATAQFCLGFLYHIGSGVALNYHRAVRWYRRAASQGETSALGNLGYCYFKGHGVAVDYQMAYKLNQEAVQMGDKCYALYTTALLLERGLGVEQDLDAAVYCYEIAASRNVPDALNALGRVYMTGLGGVRAVSIGKAFLCFYQAATRRTHPESQYSLGLICLSGGVNGLLPFSKSNLVFDVQDTEQCIADAQPNRAAMWFERAAQQGHVPAMRRLAECYHNGTHGVKESAELELYWTHLADTHADTIAHLQIGAARHEAESLFRLAVLYNHGLGVDEDLAMAYRLYTKATDQDHAMARMKLKNWEYESD